LNEEIEELVKFTYNKINATIPCI